MNDDVCVCVCDAGRSVCFFTPLQIINLVKQSWWSVTDVDSQTHKHTHTLSPELYLCVCVCVCLPVLWGPWLDPDLIRTSDLQVSVWRFRSQTVRTVFHFEAWTSALWFPPCLDDLFILQSAGQWSFRKTIFNNVRTILSSFVVLKLCDQRF